MSARRVRMLNENGVTLGFASEEQFMQSVIELAGHLGYLVYHTRRSKGSAPGFPDLVLLRTRNGCERLVFAELKLHPSSQRRGRPTEAQDEWLESLRLIGDLVDRDLLQAHVWRPADWFSGEIDLVLR